MPQMLGSTDVWVLPIYRYLPKQPIKHWPQWRHWQNAVVCLTHADNLHKKAQRTKSRQLSCSNASRYVFINKQTRWTMIMEHTSAIAAKTKASSQVN